MWAVGIGVGAALLLGAPQGTADPSFVYKRALEKAKQEREEREERTREEAERRERERLERERLQQEREALDVDTITDELEPSEPEPRPQREVRPTPSGRRRGAGARGQPLRSAAVLGSFDARVLNIAPGPDDSFYVETGDGQVHASCDGGVSWRSFSFHSGAGRVEVDEGLLKMWRSRLLGHGGKLSFNTQRIFGLSGSAPECVSTHCPFTASFKRHGRPESRMLRSAGLASGDLSYDYSVPSSSSSAPKRAWIRVSPEDARRAWVSGERGLFETKDCGASWAPASGDWAASGKLALIFEEPRLASGVVVETDAGLARLKDGAVEPVEYPDVEFGWVRSPPGRARHRLLHTHDQLWRSTNEGASWSKIADRGGYALVFDGPQRWLLIGKTDVSQSTDEGITWTPVEFQAPAELRTIGVSGSDPSRWAAIAGEHVWVSYDAGARWHPVMPSARTPLRLWWQGDELFVVSDRELVHMQTAARSSPDPDGLRVLRRRIDEEPTAEATVEHVLRNLGLHGDQIRNHGSPRLAGFLPVLGGGFEIFIPNAVSQFDSSTNYPDSEVFPNQPPPADANEFDALFPGGGRPGGCVDNQGVPVECGAYDRKWRPFSSLDNEFLLERRYSGPQYYVGFTAKWDTDEMFSSSASRAVERMMLKTQPRRQRVVDLVLRVYRARREFMQHLLTVPPLDLNSRYQLALTVEELTAQLDGLSGGQWTDALDWLVQHRMESLR